MEYTYPENMTRQEALSRRATKLIGWLGEGRYAQYTGEDSAKRLKDLIKLIIWALEQSIDPGDWREYLAMFQDARKCLVTEEGREAEGYNEAVNSLIGTLERYRGYVEE